jgi:hypothetical protein
VFFYLKCVTSREKFPGGETNLSRLLERAAVLQPQGQEEEKSPEDLAVASLLQLVAVALGRNNFRVAGLPELISHFLLQLYLASTDGLTASVADLDHISESIETIFWVKIIKFFHAVPAVFS